MRAIDTDRNLAGIETSTLMVSMLQVTRQARLHSFRARETYDILNIYEYTAREIFFTEVAKTCWMAGAIS